MKKRKNILAIQLIMLFIAGCSKGKVEDKKPIKIGVDVFPGWGHIFIAHEKGFFQKNGVDVEIILNKDYLTIQKQFNDDELDGAFMVYADAIYLADHGSIFRINLLPVMLLPQNRS